MSHNFRVRPESDSLACMASVDLYILLCGEGNLLADLERSDVILSVSILLQNDATATVYQLK